MRVLYCLISCLWPETSAQKQVPQLALAVLEQLNRNLEELRIMSTRALSDAATQYCEIVELTDLIRKYELQWVEFGYFSLSIFSLGCRLQISLTRRVSTSCGCRSRLSPGARTWLPTASLDLKTTIEWLSGAGLPFGSKTFNVQVDRLANYCALGFNGIYLPSFYFQLALPTQMRSR